MKQKNRLLSAFVEGADQSFFPIHNLPYGVFSTNDRSASPRVGTAIGDFVLDLAVLENEGLLKFKKDLSLFNQPTLNLFASQGKEIWEMVRDRLQSLLNKENDELQKNKKLLAKALLPMSEVTLLMPFKVDAFSDFYASEYHATNVGKLFRGKENALLPNWKFLPVGYHGRASTLFLSGASISRPMGQIKNPEQDSPVFTACKKLDFELELGFFIGVGNPDGRRISIQNAKDHIFGLTLLNDWSARDIQAFEYQPLGPFLSKSFATSISPWIVPYQAFAESMKLKPKQIPEVTDYLKQDPIMQPDIKLRAELQPHGKHSRTLLCETTSAELYWTMEQMLAHHTVNNCIMQTGDLLGTGTISGPQKENWGSLLEITFNGTAPIKLADGQERKFLEDGDTIIITGFAETDNYKIGFGDLKGTIVASQQN